MSQIGRSAFAIILILVIASCGGNDLRRDVAERHVDFLAESPGPMYVSADCLTDLFSAISDADVNAVWEDQFGAEISDDGRAKSAGFAKQILEECLDMEGYSTAVGALAGQDVEVELECLKRSIPGFSELEAIRRTSDLLMEVAYACGTNG